MSIHTTLETDAHPFPTTTASGARLKSIRAVAALTFFEQYAAPIRDAARHIDAWGAFEDRTTLIGAAAIARVSPATFWVQVAVAPERRRLGIGAELLSVVVREASAGRGRRLIGSYPASAIEPRLLIESLGFVVARRLQCDHAEFVLFIPTEPACTPGDTG